MINYSVVIRTLGKTGEKYQTLLNSVAKQTIRPLEVLVVIPYGYDLPKEQLGYERFVRCEKGMVRQHLIGGQEAKGEYILFLDDDLEFEEDFVERLYQPIAEGVADASFPPLFELLPPKKGMRKIIPWLSRSAVPSSDKTHYTKVLKSGGWSYYRFEGKKNVPPYLYAQSAPWACGFWKKEDFINIRYEDDLWLEDTGYALWDDQLAYYKLYLSGRKIACVTNLRYTHLDGGGKASDRRILSAYAGSRNKYIFWYKYIYLQQNTKWGKLTACWEIAYSRFVSRCIGFIQACFQSRKREEYKMFIKGQKDGKKYVKKLKEKNK